MAESYREFVTTTAKTLDLLDDAGRLRPMDSLAIADFVATVEDELRVRLPPIALEPPVYKSIDSIAEMLARVAPRG